MPSKTGMNLIHVFLADFVEEARSPLKPSRRRFSLYYDESLYLRIGLGLRLCIYPKGKNSNRCSFYTLRHCRSPVVRPVMCGIHPKCSTMHQQVLCLAGRNLLFPLTPSNCTQVVESRCIALEGAASQASLHHSMGGRADHKST
jgi:Fe-S-cluster containining protein